MSAISNLGFAMQAADVGTRAAIGLGRCYQHIHRSRDDRLAEYTDTLQAYDIAIENLSSGGGALSVDTNHPFRAYLAKMIATTFSIRTLCGLNDIESQSSSDQHTLETLADDEVWLDFLRLKADLSRLEKGLQHLTASCLMQLMYGLRHKLFWMSS